MSHPESDSRFSVLGAFQERPDAFVPRPLSEEARASPHGQRLQGDTAVLHRWVGALLGG